MADAFDMQGALPPKAYSPRVQSMSMLRSCISASSANCNQRVKLQVRLADQARFQHEHLTLFVGSPVKVVGDPPAFAPETPDEVASSELFVNRAYTHTLTSKQTNKKTNKRASK